MVLKMKCPDGLSAVEFSEYRGHLIQEIHLLVCGEADRRVPCQVEFNERAKLVSGIFWMAGSIQLGNLHGK